MVPQLPLSLSVLFLFFVESEQSSFSSSFSPLLSPSSEAVRISPLPRELMDLMAFLGCFDRSRLALCCHQRRGDSESEQNRGGDDGGSALLDLSLLRISKWWSSCSSLFYDPRSDNTLTCNTCIDYIETSKQYIQTKV